MADGSPAAGALDPSDQPAPLSEEAAASSVMEKKKRGRKRKEPGESKKEVTAEKKERKPPVVVEGASVERPARERKTVVRLIQMSPPKAPVSKVLTIEQGPGTKLKDIPNVFFKLSKRKIDENLQVLHTVLFGRKSNAHYLKRNISQFSGFVWAGNEEKQRVRVKEKLDKCTKDRLLDFSDLLDIQIARTTAKKEEITERLLEFLVSPHVTRDVVLTESEKKGKRKRAKAVGQYATTGASSEGEAKKLKSSLKTEGKKRRRRSDKIKKEVENVAGLEKEEEGVLEKEEDDEHGSDVEGDVEEGGYLNKDDLSSAGKADGDTDDHVKSEEEDDEGGPEESMAGTNGSEEKLKAAEYKIKEKASPVKKYSLAKSDKSSLKPVREDSFSDEDVAPSLPARSKRDSSKGPASGLSKANKKEIATTVNKCSSKSLQSIPKSSPTKNTVDNSDSVPSSSSRPKREKKKKYQDNDDPVPKDSKAVQKQAAKVSSKVSTKEQGKAKAVRKAKLGPSKEELHSVVSKILKEVDFNTATLADILKQLGAHFNTNLMDRKEEVKHIIQDVINTMTDEDDDDEDDDGDEDEDDAVGAEGTDDDAEGADIAKEDSDEDDE